MSAMALQLAPWESGRLTPWRKSLMLRSRWPRMANTLPKFSLPSSTSSFPPRPSQTSTISSKLLSSSSQLPTLHRLDRSSIDFSKLSSAAPKAARFSLVFSSRTILKRRQVCARSAARRSWRRSWISVRKAARSLPSLLLSSMSSLTVSCSLARRAARTSCLRTARRVFWASTTTCCQWAAPLVRRCASSRCCTASCASPSRKASSHSCRCVLPTSSLLARIFPHSSASLSSPLARPTSPNSTSTRPISSQHALLERGCSRLGGGTVSKVALSAVLPFWYSARRRSSLACSSETRRASRSSLREAWRGWRLRRRRRLSLSSSRRWQWSLRRMCLVRYLARKRRGTVSQSRPTAASRSASFTRQAQVSSGFSRAQVPRKLRFSTLGILSVQSGGSSQVRQSWGSSGRAMVRQGAFSCFQLSLLALSWSSLKVCTLFSRVRRAYFLALRAKTMRLARWVWMQAMMVQMRNSRSRCTQFSAQGFASSSRTENTLFVLLFFTDFAARPERPMRETPLALERLEADGFFSGLPLMSFWEDLTDRDWDFLLLRERLLLWLLTVMFSSWGSASSSSSGSSSISVRTLLAYSRFLRTVSTGSLPTRSCHSEYSMRTSTISTECSFLRISRALLQAACCFWGLGAMRASFTQSLAWREGSASLMLLMACSSFLPCLLMKAILASHTGFCRALGSSSSIISATYSPSLNSPPSQDARKYNCDSNSSRSGSESSLSSFRKPSTVLSGTTSLARLALLSCSRALTFHTCLPASTTRMLIPHLNPFLAASTPLPRASTSSPSTLPASCVLGLTSLSRASEDRNQARLYQRRRLEGMAAGSAARLWARAFQEQRRAYLSILGLSSLEARRASFTQSQACSSSSVSSCSLGFHPSSPSKQRTICASQSALLGAFWMSSSWLLISRMKVSLKPGALAGGGAPFLGSAGLPPAALPPETRALMALMSLRVLGERLVRRRSSQTFSTWAGCFWASRRRAQMSPMLEKACILSSRSQQTTPLASTSLRALRMASKQSLRRGARSGRSLVSLAVTLKMWTKLFQRQMAPLKMRQCCWEVSAKSRLRLRQASTSAFLSRPSSSSNSGSRFCWQSSSILICARQRQQWPCAIISSTAFFTSQLSPSTSSAAFLAKSLSSHSNDSCATSLASSFRRFYDRSFSRSYSTRRRLTSSSTSMRSGGTAKGGGSQARRALRHFWRVSILVVSLLWSQMVQRSWVTWSRGEGAASCMFLRSTFWRKSRRQRWQGRAQREGSSSGSGLWGRRAVGREGSRRRALATLLSTSANMRSLSKQMLRSWRWSLVRSSWSLVSICSRRARARSRGRAAKAWQWGERKGRAMFQTRSAPSQMSSALSSFLLMSITFSMILSASLRFSISSSLICWALMLIPVFLSTQSPFFFTSSSALLYSFSTSAFWLGCRVFPRKPTIALARFPSEKRSAIRPASASRSCITGDSCVELVLSLVLRTPSEIWLTMVISSFSTCASGTSPDRMRCKASRTFQALGSAPSVSFLTAATRALFSLVRQTRRRKRESWNSHGRFLVRSQSVSSTLNASGLRSASQRHWQRIIAKRHRQLWSGSSTSYSSRQMRSYTSTKARCHPGLSMNRVTLQSVVEALQIRKAYFPLLPASPETPPFASFPFAASCTGAIRSSARDTNPRASFSEASISSPFSLLLWAEQATTLAFTRSARIKNWLVVCTRSKNSPTSSAA